MQKVGLGIPKLGIQRSGVRTGITLFGWDLREVGGRLFCSALIVEFDPDSMSADFPIHKIDAVLKMAKDRNRNVETWQFIASDRIKSSILHSTIQKYFSIILIK